MTPERPSPVFDARTEIPAVRTTASLGGRSDRLVRSPQSQRLGHGVWARMSTEPTHLQKAVLLRSHLSTPEEPLALTGVTALDLLGLPLSGSGRWVTQILGDRPAPRGSDLRRARESWVHLAWHVRRRRCGLEGVHVTRSYGLDPVRGPNGALLTDPVEALVVAAPMLESWVLTAVLDALLSGPVWPSAPWSAVARHCAEPLARDPLQPPERAHAQTTAMAPEQARAPGRARAPEQVRARDRATASKQVHLAASELWVLPPEWSVPLIEGRLLRLPPTSRAVVAVRAALQRCALGTWSPMETLVRLIAVHAGFPSPVMNHRVATGYGIRHLDLAWPESMTALEFNGRVHSQDHVTYKDEMHRLEVLRDEGWAVRVLVHDDLREPRRRKEWLMWLARHLAT